MDIGLSQDCKTFVAAVGSKIVVFGDPSCGGGVPRNDVVVLSLNYETITSLAISADGCRVVIGINVEM